LLLTLALPVHALTFQTRMEEVEWSVEGDKFECRLTQPVSGYGDAVFVRRAGERPVFELKAWNNLMQPGQAQLYNDAPTWQPQARARLLGFTDVSDDLIAVRVPQQQAGQMLAGLADGLHPTIQRTAWANAVEPVRVVVSSIGYQDAWADFQKCSAGLLSMNFEQVSRSVVSFANGGSALSASAKQLLDTALEYIQADEEISGIVLEGHSDNVGNRLDNRELARQRALVVRDYLMQRGVEEELFTLRFHGDRYPVASNRSADGRAKNRRVTLKLDKS
jgi:outer membrane protein OmpA-like peptidoglycan-associated protein